MSAMQDMTKGGAAGHLLRYAVPLMLGNWFQLAYNAVDSIIAGRFIGKDALAAEGIAGPVMNLVILGITGVCLGAGVLMSEFFGAKDGESLRRELATTVLSGTAACTVVALLGVLFTPAILQACAVPREIFAITAIYLRITFLGAPFTCFYNALAAGFKSVGDARTPLRFLMVSAILNAALDLIFIGGLGFGIVCSAMTTVIAEAPCWPGGGCGPKRRNSAPGGASGALTAACWAARCNMAGYPLCSRPCSQSAKCSSRGR